MDTRFWGPSGWKMLHLMAAEPLRTASHRAAVAEWIGLLEYALPCKYCRASFHDYLRLQPLMPATLESPTVFSRWMYDIHNRVNGKLRGQGLLTESDPDWPTVRDRYRSLHSTLCEEGTPLLGWDFMLSVAYATPSASAPPPVPMPDAPEDSADWAAMDDATKNRYNLLDRPARLKYLYRWWALIPSILPCAAWRRAWGQALRAAGAPPLERGRQAVMRWMWVVEERVCAGLRCPLPHPSRAVMEAEVGAFESGCGRARRGVTCRTRRRRRGRIQTQRHQRARLAS